MSDAPITQQPLGTSLDGNTQCRPKLDKHGRVIAVKGLRPPPPWEVQESSHFPGRWFYLNKQSGETCWTLDPWTIRSGLTKTTVASKSMFILSESINLPEAAPSIGIKKGRSFQSSLDRAVERSDQDKTSASTLTLQSITRNGGYGTKIEACAALDGDYNSKNRTLLPFLNAGTLLASKSGRMRLYTRALPSPLKRGLSSSGSFGEFQFMQGQPAVKVQRMPLVVTGGLGQGGYAVVLKAAHSETQEPFALKVVSKQSAPTKRERQRLKLELKVMTDVEPSPFLQRCHMAFESKNDIFFVVDFFSGGDLFGHLVQRVQKSKSGFTEAEARTLLAEVVLGLHHLHAHGYVHRDIKVENIMLDAAGHVKLVDFGLAKPFKGDVEPMSQTGSLIYMAPEVIRDGMGGRHTDWWAMGIVAHELMTGCSPWSSLTDKKVIRNEILKKNVAPPMKLSPRAGQLICSLLRQDYRVRLGTKADVDVRNAPFFMGVDWEATLEGQTPPAFLPGPNAVSKADSEAAVEAYLARKAVYEDDSGDFNCADYAEVVAAGEDASGVWFMGLDVTVYPPEYTPALSPGASQQAQDALDV